MRFQLENKDLYVVNEGSDDLPSVVFRQVDPFRLWVWVEFNQLPSAKDREMLESVVKAWFMLGKLGGYNSGNMQVCCPACHQAFAPRWLCFFFHGKPLKSALLLSFW